MFQREKINITDSFIRTAIRKALPLIGVQLTERVQGVRKLIQHFASDCILQLWIGL